MKDKRDVDFRFSHQTVGWPRNQRICSITYIEPKIPVRISSPIHLVLSASQRASIERRDSPASSIEALKSPVVALSSLVTPKGQVGEVTSVRAYRGNLA